MKHVIVEQVEVPTLYPVTKPLHEIRIAGQTLSEVIRARFQPVDERRITIRADFFISSALALMLSATGCNIEVKDKDGCVLVRVEVAPGEPFATFERDIESIVIRYPWQLIEVMESLIGTIKDDEILGNIRPNVNIDGRIRLGNGSILLPGVFIEGNVVIGSNCKIGPNCYIRGNTSIGNNCHIGQAVEIKNSLLFDNIAIGHLSYVGDSVICDRVNFGAGTIISNFRHDGQTHRFKLDGEFIDTGRRKMGAIIGEDVHTGIHTAIYPGRIIAPGTHTRPGGIVEK